MNRDVFISYRRKGGIQTALWVKRELEQLGYDVFLDIEGLDHGPFDEQIYTEIDNSINFLIILSLDALERCKYEDDWVRKEIVHALEMKKNIIPFMLEDFIWPEKLPDEIEKINRQQGLKFVTEYPVAVIEKLTKLLIRHNRYERSGITQEFKPETENKLKNVELSEKLELHKDIEIIEPHKKKIFGFGFDDNDIKSIVSKLEEMKSNLQKVLAVTEQECVVAYGYAELIMIYVKKQLAAYNHWNFNTGKTVGIFVKNYEPNLSEIERTVCKGERFLSDENKRSLSQIATGLDDIIASLKG